MMAGDKFSIDIKGLPELVESLKALPAALGSKGGGPIRRQLAKSATLIREAVKARVPVDTGTLRDHIAILRDRRPGQSQASERYMVGIRGGTMTKYTNNSRNRRMKRVGQKFQKMGAAFYGRFVELGTSKQKSQPFLRPGFNDTASEAILQFLAGLQKDIEKLAAKAVKGSLK